MDVLLQVTLTEQSVPNAGGRAREYRTPTINAIQTEEGRHGAKRWRSFHRVSIRSVQRPRCDLHPTNSSTERAQTLVTLDGNDVV